MTNDMRLLGLMLFVFWGAWWILMVVARRSYVPVIPFVPLALAAAGYALNKVYPWAGTCSIAAFHLGLLALMIRDGLRRPPREDLLGRQTMPKTLFTATPREHLKIGEVLRHATCTAADGAEEQFLVGNCRITCRYRTEPGDFVSKQVLGCHNAVRTGVLRCADRELTIDRILRTQAVVGIVGPDDEVDGVASALAARLGGVLVSATDAVAVGDG